jgi:hypothetical protein
MSGLQKNRHSLSGIFIIIQTVRRLLGEHPKITIFLSISLSIVGLAVLFSKSFFCKKIRLILNISGLRASYVMRVLIHTHKFFAILAKRCSKAIIVPCTGCIHRICGCLADLLHCSNMKQQ